MELTICIMTEDQFNQFIEKKLIAYLEAHNVPNKWKRQILAEYKTEPWPCSTVISRAFSWSKAIDVPRDFFFLLHSRWYTFCNIWKKKLRGDYYRSVNVETLLTWNHDHNSHIENAYKRIFLIKYERLFAKYC